MPVRQSAAYWLALGQVKGLGGVGFKKLASCFADPTEAFFVSRTELERSSGLSGDIADALVNFSEWHAIDEELRRAAEAEVAIVPFNASGYPDRLRMIADPPPFLYVKGDLLPADERAVAVVGTRSASDYGRRMARDLARGLAGLGFTIVSGLARGIDGVAHASALEAGGRTIAVLGSGVERPYPPEHAELYRRVLRQGAIVSEFALGTRPLAFNFPARNRLISGLSLGVVVVEATEKSGSLITASFALEQGREVFAVPGAAGASRSRGPHRLIREGAKLVETAEDIVEEIAPQLLGRRAPAAAERQLPPGAGENTRRILALLQIDSLQVDQLIERTGIAPAEVLQILLDLELRGFVRQPPGKRYAAEN